MKLKLIDRHTKLGQGGCCCHSRTKSATFTLVASMEPVYWAFHLHLFKFIHKLVNHLELHSKLQIEGTLT